MGSTELIKELNFDKYNKPVLDHFCRICLRKCHKLYSVDGQHSNLRKIVSIIFITYDLSVEPEARICEECSEKLDYCYALRLEAQRMNIVYNEMLRHSRLIKSKQNNQTKNKNTNVEPAHIKLKPLSKITVTNANSENANQQYTIAEVVPVQGQWHISSENPSTSKCSNGVRLFQAKTWEVPVDGANESELFEEEHKSIKQEHIEEDFENIADEFNYRQEVVDEDFVEQTQRIKEEHAMEVEDYTPSNMYLECPYTMVNAVYEEDSAVEGPSETFRKSRISKEFLQEAIHNAVTPEDNGLPIIKDKMSLQITIDNLADMENELYRFSEHAAEIRDFIERTVPVDAKDSETFKQIFDDAFWIEFNYDGKQKKRSFRKEGERLAREIKNSWSRHERFSGERWLEAFKDLIQLAKGRNRQIVSYGKIAPAKLAKLKFMRESARELRLQNPEMAPKNTKKRKKSKTESLPSSALAVE